MTDTRTPAEGPLWTKMTPDQFGGSARPVQTSLFPDPDGCGTFDLFDALDTPAPAPTGAVEPCNNCDGDNAAVCGCCPACDTTKTERCLSCGSCRCDRHDHCGPGVVQAAATVLATAHTPAAVNSYGACARPGYSVNPGPGGRARIHHRFPNLNILDPNRLPQAQRWTEARARADAYAVTLEAAGWTVERRTVTTGAILLAAPPTAAGQA